MRLFSITVGLVLFLSLVLESEQAKGLMRKRRSIIISDEGYRWPGNTIKYVFETQDPARVSAVEIVLAEYEARTCLKFQKVSRNDPGYKIVVTDTKKGCYTYAGYLRGRKEMVLNLGRGCETLGTARHEWQHVMGVMHQQSAPDRDNHIKFHPENVFDPSWVPQFRKLDARRATYLGGRYDFRSSMHYGSASAAKPGKETMIAHDRKNHNMIDHRDNHHLSFYDLYLINKAYKCGDKCRGSCSNGYMDKNCKCVTPNDPIFGGNSLTNLKWPPTKPSSFVPTMRTDIINKVRSGALSVTRAKSELPGETDQPVAGKTYRSRCRNGVDVYYEKTTQQFLVVLKSSRPPPGCFIGNRYLHPNRQYGENRVSGISDVYKRVWLIFYAPGFRPARVVME